MGIMDEAVAEGERADPDLDRRKADRRWRWPRLLGSQPRRVAASHALNQVAMVATLPLLARIYPSYDFAVYQVAFSFSLIIQALLTGGMEYRLPAVRSSSERRRLTMRSFKVLSLGTALFAGVAIGLDVSSRADWATTLNAAVVIAASLALSSLVSANWIARGLFSRVVRANVVSAAAVAVLQVLLGVYLPSVWAMITALLVGRLLGIGLAITSVLTREPATNSSRSSTLSEGPDESSAGFKWISSVLISNVVLQLPVVVLSLRGDPFGAAEFALASRLVGVAATLLGTGLSQGIVARVVQLMRERSDQAASEYVIAVQRRLLVISLALGIFTTVLAPVLVPAALGAEWAHAGYLCAILGIPFSLQMANRALIPMFLYFRQTLLLLYAQSARLGTLGLSLLALFLLSEISSLSMTICAAVVNLIFFCVFPLVVRRALLAGRGPQFHLEGKN